MKKEDISSLIVYAIILTTALLTLFLGINPLYAEALDKPSFEMGEFVITLLSFLGALFVAGVSIEISHVIGAKLGKYEIVSFNLFYFCFYKTSERKIKFKFKSFDGIMGETIVKPKLDQNNDKFISNPKPMLYLPIFMLTALVVASSVVYAYFTKSIGSVIGVVLLLVFSLLLFYDILPIKLDSVTDGYQISIVSKKANVDAFNELLRVRSCNILGTEPGDTKIFEEITDYTFEINLVRVYKYLSEENYNEGLKLLEKMYDNSSKLRESNKLRLIAQILYLLLITDSFNKASKFYYESISSEERKNLSNYTNIECIRSYVLVAGLLEDSEAEVQYSTSKANSAYRKIESGRKEIEKTLYKKALEKVKQKHPTWTLIIKAEVKKDKAVKIQDHVVENQKETKQEEDDED